MLRRTFLLHSVSAAIGSSAAREGGGEHRVHRSSIAGRAVRAESLVYVPDEARSKRMPLLVWLHGASLRGEDVRMVKRYGPPAVAEEWGTFPFVVLSPQCPPGRLWTEDDGAFIRLVDEAMEQYRIDPKRVYLTGLSMGGGGTWYFGSRYASRFAAIVPMCGPTQPAQWAAGLKKMPVWVFHGERDEVVPLKRSKDMVEALRRVGNKPRFSVLKGKGHDITAVYKDDAIYRWLAGKKVRKV